MSLYGYMRVSTREQNEDRQRAALGTLDIPAKNLYMDKLSGKDFNRPKWRTLVRRIKKDDILYAKSIDRIGRNYEEILEEWRKITKDKGADIVVLDMPLLDTRRGKDLIGSFIADLVLQILSFVAQTEREFIHQRQAEGIKAAKARGVRFGRPPTQVPDGFMYAYDSWKRKEMTATAIAGEYGMSISTCLNLLKSYQKRENAEKLGRSSGKLTRNTR